MAFSFTTVTQSYGAGATGTVRFVLDTPISNGGDASGAGSGWVATLDGSGNISQQLPSTMDAGTRPQGARMKVHEVIAGRLDRIYYVQIPTSGPVVLGSLPKTDDSGAATATGLFVTPNPSAGRYLFTASPAAAATNAALGNSTLRVVPWLITTPLAIDRIGAEITTVGEAGSKLRLGIFADTGSVYPGVLLLDAGQIAGDSATVQELTCSLYLPTGLYWVGGAVQSAPTTQPTVRVTSGWQPSVPLCTPNAPVAGATTVGYSQTAVTGALPAPFTSTVAGISAAPRVHVRAA